MPGVPDAGRAQLRSTLERSRRLGFLGPVAVEQHIVHAERIAQCLEDFSGSFVDLGCGGGVPGLPLALVWRASSGVLLDASARRVAFLGAALTELDLGERFEVARGRAELLGHQGQMREAFDLVVCRAFGPPATTAECGAAFTRVGGRLLVCEPPGEDGDTGARWPASGLEQLGLAPTLPAGVPGARFVVMSKVARLGSGYPRRVGVPTKRPLWAVGTARER